MRINPVLQIVRRIDVAVRGVKWSDNGDLVAILSEASFYVLSHDREVCAPFLLLCPKSCVTTTELVSGRRGGPQQGVRLRAIARPRGLLNMLLQCLGVLLIVHQRTQSVHVSEHRGP